MQQCLWEAWGVHRFRSWLGRVLEELSSTFGSHELPLMPVLFAMLGEGVRCHAPGSSAVGSKVGKDVDFSFLVHVTGDGFVCLDLFEVDFDNFGRGPILESLSKETIPFSVEGRPSSFSLVPSTHLGL